MAELDTSSGGGHKKGPGVKKGKKLSTRVDLTPMVDLGFLLITFFIFTTTMSQPTALKLFLPDDKITDEPNKAKESGVLTILMGADNHIYYYEGQLKPDASNFLSASYNGENSIREIIMKKKVQVRSIAQDPSDPEKDLVIVIKPSSKCNYKNVIDILDEMSINVVKKYALVDIFDIEEQLVQKSDANAKSSSN